MPTRLAAAEARWLRPVVPGEQVRIRVSRVAERFQAVGEVDGETVATASFRLAPAKISAG